MMALLPIAWLLFRWRRQGRPDQFVLGAYLAATGSVRFAIEFLRMRESLFGPFAVAHVLSLAAIRCGRGPVVDEPSKSWADACLNGDAVPEVDTFSPWGGVAPAGCRPAAAGGSPSSTHSGIAGVFGCQLTPVAQSCILDACWFSAGSCPRLR